MFGTIGSCCFFLFRDHALPGEEGGHSSQDKWRNSQPQGIWQEISAETDAVGTIVKEKTNTWNESFKESVMRESELCKMVEQAVIDERQEHRERSMTKYLLHQLQKRREEKDEARGLIDEAQRNLDEAHTRSCEVERKIGPSTR